MPPKTHDLANLCNLCSELDSSILDMLPQCSYLTQFGVRVRYPKELHLTSSNVDQAVRYALEVKKSPAITDLREYTLG